MKIKVSRMLKVNIPAGANLLLSLVGIDNDEIPEEQDIWLDTNKIIEIDDVLPGKLSNGAFSVYVEGRTEPLYIKEEYFKTLMTAWLNIEDENDFGN